MALIRKDAALAPGDPRPSAGRPATATVVRVDFGGCRLESGDGVMFDATVRGRLMGHRKSLGNAVVVGDRVGLEWEQERAMVASVEPRRNAFSRRASGNRPAEQVVAANVDLVVVVAALLRPEFRHGLVDRVLVQADSAGIPALLALNKADLGGPEEVREIAAEYGRAGVEVRPLSALSGDGVEAVRAACRARRALFIGHSGVGKSTLLAALAPGHELLQGDVNQRTGKGRHTTTAALLLRPSPDLELIDTPGVRAFGLWGVAPADLAAHYPELRERAGTCRFRDCRHDREPGCALREAFERGDIGARRFESFRKLQAELEAEQGGW